MISQQNKPSIRMANRADAAAIAQLLEDIEAKTISTASVVEKLTKTKEIEIILVAEILGNIVGMACLRLVPSISLSNPHAEVSELYIKPDQRGKKFEKELLLQAEIISKKQGASQLILHTGLKNSEAQSLYQSLGFQNYALAMRKQLSV